MLKYETVTDFSSCADWIIGVHGTIDLKLLNNLPLDLPSVSEKDFTGEMGSQFILNQNNRRFIFLGLGAFGGHFEKKSSTERCL